MKIFSLLLLLVFVQMHGSERQTICLNMIVKNESKVIARCLESVKPLIDYWVISDTGSTDNTKELILETMKGIPGELHEHPWKDFGHNRNNALKLAKGKADFILFIDADETLVFEENFSFPYLDKDFYFFSVLNEIEGQLLSEYKRILLIDNSLDWEWEGVLHEVVTCPEAKNCELLEGVTNISRTREGFRASDPDKYLKDALVLEKALKDDPGNTRYVLHLGLSYIHARKYDLALKAFQRRIDMTPGVQGSAEIYLSLYEIGCIQIHCQEAAEKIIANLTAAHLYRPAQAEPLYQLGEYFLFQNNPFLAYLVLKQALEIPFPKRELIFIEPWIYDWAILFRFAESAFKIGRLQESKVAIEKLLPNPNLPESLRDELQDHLAQIESAVFLIN